MNSDLYWGAIARLPEYESLMGVAALCIWVQEFAREVQKSNPLSVFPCCWRAAAVAYDYGPR